MMVFNCKLFVVLLLDFIVPLKLLLRNDTFRLNLLKIISGLYFNRRISFIVFFDLKISVNLFDQN
jgi:hypothetical protein